MPGVAAHGAVDRGVGERERLGLAGERTVGADGLRQDRAHLVERLHGDHVVAGARERRGQPTGAGADVQQPRTAGVLGDRVHDLRWIARASEVVGVGHVAEAAREIRHPLSG